MLLKRRGPIDCFVSFLLVMRDQSAHPLRMVPMARCEPLVAPAILSKTKDFCHEGEDLDHRRNRQCMTTRPKLQPGCFDKRGLFSTVPYPSKSRANRLLVG
jgi:hypothetical protein